MNKTLGITVNYNCISWALLDNLRQSPIIQTGVRVFQPSVLNLGSGLLEESHLALRTKFRNSRKSISRRQYCDLIRTADCRGFFRKRVPCVSRKY